MARQKQYVSCATWSDDRWLSWLALIADAGCVSIDLIDDSTVRGAVIQSYCLESLTVRLGMAEREFRRDQIAFVRTTEFPVERDCGRDVSRLPLFAA